MGRSSDIETGIEEWEENWQSRRSRRKKEPLQLCDDPEKAIAVFEPNKQRRSHRPVSFLSAYHAYLQLKEAPASEREKYYGNPKTPKQYAIRFFANFQIAEETWDEVFLHVEPEEILADSIPGMFPTEEERQEMARRQALERERPQQQGLEYKAALRAGEISFKTQYAVPDGWEELLIHEIQITEQHIDAEQHAMIFDHLTSTKGASAARAYRTMVETLPTDFSTEKWRVGILNLVRNNWEYKDSGRPGIPWQDTFEGNQMQAAFRAIYGQSPTEKARAIFLEASKE